jgi:hypothetical protein
MLSLRGLVLSSRTARFVAPELLEQWRGRIISHYVLGLVWLVLVQFAVVRSSIKTKLKSS